MTWDNATNTQGAGLIASFSPVNGLEVTSKSRAPDGDLSNAYSWCNTAVGGTGSYTWAVTAGVLQNGLSLNTSTGCVTGTATSSSDNAITFQVTDGASSTATKVVNLKIVAALGAQPNAARLGRATTCAPWLHRHASDLPGREIERFVRAMGEVWATAQSTYPNSVGGCTWPLMVAVLRRVVEREAKFAPVRRTTSPILRA